MVDAYLDLFHSFGFIGFIAAIATPVVAIVMIMTIIGALVERRNQWIYADMIRKIDGDGAWITPGAGCTTKSIADRFGNRVSYQFWEDCVSRHGSEGCIRRKDDGGTFFMSTETTTYFIPQPDDVTYEPSVVAWQTSRRNSAIRVPLYPSATPGMLWRFDGKLLNAACLDT